MKRLFKSLHLVVLGTLLTIITVQAALTDKALLVPVIMIKNEEPVICKTLQPFVDAGIKHFFVYDTGSTDNTVAVTKEFFAANNITDGVVVQEPFVDFSTSRNRALELTATTFPNMVFMLMLDAEWYLHNVSGLLQFCSDHEGGRGEYYALHLFAPDKTDGIYNRLIRRGHTTKFVHAVHEYFGGNPDKVLPADVFFIYAPSRQGSINSSQRHLRDATLLLREYEESEERIHHAAFYLGQTYACLGDAEKSLQWYKQYLATTTKREKHRDFIYLAHQKRGNIFELQNNWDSALEEYLAAFAASPDRAEPLVQIAKHYHSTKEFELCRQFALRAVDMSYPSKNNLFVEREVYTLTRYAFLSGAYLGIGDYERGKETALLALKNHPENEVMRKIVATCDTIMHIMQ